MPEKFSVFSVPPSQSPGLSSPASSSSTVSPLRAVSCPVSPLLSLSGVPPHSSVDASCFVLPSELSSVSCNSSVTSHSSIAMSDAPPGISSVVPATSANASDHSAYPESRQGSSSPVPSLSTTHEDAEATQQEGEVRSFPSGKIPVKLHSKVALQLDFERPMPARNETDKEKQSIDVGLVRHDVDKAEESSHQRYASHAVDVPASTPPGSLANEDVQDSVDDLELDIARVIPKLPAVSSASVLYNSPVVCDPSQPVNLLPCSPSPPTVKTDAEAVSRKPVFSPVVCHGRTCPPVAKESAQSKGMRQISDACSSRTLPNFVSNGPTTTWKPSTTQLGAAKKSAAPPSFQPEVIVLSDSDVDDDIGEDDGLGCAPPLLQHTNSRSSLVGIGRSISSLHCVSCAAVSDLCR